VKNYTPNYPVMKAEIMRAKDIFGQNLNL